MTGRKENGFYHVLALLTVAIWGSTFISTKIVLNEGLTPAAVMFYRFAVAYVLILPLAGRRIFADNLGDEGWMAAAGICGGSLYFQTENMAIGMTLTTNVALIICTAPLFTALLSRLIYRQERFGKRMWIGSGLALTGVALVVFNGHFVLKISPAGDLLTLTAALSWAFYTLILRKLNGKYSTFFLTRKVFFYGLLTLLPVFLITPLDPNPAILSKPVVLGNLLFLGVFASFACFAVWNVVIARIGSVRASNYIYLNPLFTLIASSLFLDEPVTAIALAGAFCIIGGVWMAEKG